MPELSLLKLIKNPYVLGILAIIAIFGYISHQSNVIKKQEAALVSSKAVAVAQKKVTVAVVATQKRVAEASQELSNTRIHNVERVAKQRKELDSTNLDAERARQLFINELNCIEKASGGDSECFE